MAKRTQGPDKWENSVMKATGVPHLDWLVDDCDAWLMPFCYDVLKKLVEFGGALEEKKVRRVLFEGCSKSS